MKLMKSAVLVSLLCIGSQVSAQQTIELQQGVDNYNGFTWTNLIKPGKGTNKYERNLTGEWLLSALFQC